MAIRSHIPHIRHLDKRALFRNHPIFGGLSPELIELLCSKASVRRESRGEAIFAKGDDGNGLFAVLSGVVKIGVSSRDGREVVFNLIHPGEIFGEIALLDGRPRTADAAAMTECELLFIDRRDFAPIIGSQPEIAIRLIELLCARLRWTSEQYEEVMFLDFPGRLAKTLLRLAERIGTSTGGQNVAITQREISNFLGKSRESTNKQLRAWVRRGWVSLERSRVIVLAPDQLAAIAAEGFEPHAPDETSGGDEDATPHFSAAR
jgi:CRP/FNR family transcriptional regulator, cyclic AMP receptor protein